MSRIAFFELVNILRSNRTKRFVFERKVFFYTFIRQHAVKLVVSCNNSDQCVSTTMTLFRHKGGNYSVSNLTSYFRAVGSFFLNGGRGWGAGGGALSKNVFHHGWLTSKIFLKNWLKRPKAVSKNRNLDQNVNDSKYHIWNFCFFHCVFFFVFFFL